MSARITQRLLAARAEHLDRVGEACTVVSTTEGRTRWWTWAGGRANTVLTALKQLRFADLLPPELARATLERRLSDPVGTLAILGQPIATAS